MVGFPHSSLGNTTLSSKKRGFEHCSPGCEIPMFSDFGWLNPSKNNSLFHLGSFRWTKKPPRALRASFFPTLSRDHLNWARNISSAPTFVWATACTRAMAWMGTCAGLWVAREGPWCLPEWWVCLNGNFRVFSRDMDEPAEWFRFLFP